MATKWVVQMPAPETTPVMPSQVQRRQSSDAGTLEYRKKVAKVAGRQTNAATKTSHQLCCIVMQRRTLNIEDAPKTRPTVTARG
jgi:hypothetical protein